MDDNHNRLMATLRKSANDEIRVELCPFKGRYFLGMRIWSKGDDGKFHPSPTKGLTVSISHAQALKDAIDATLAAANEEQPEKRAAK